MGHLLLMFVRRRKLDLANKLPIGKYCCFIADNGLIVANVLYRCNTVLSGLSLVYQAILKVSQCYYHHYGVLNK